jgi:hypothetical protein
MKDGKIEGKTTIRRRRKESVRKSEKVNEELDIKKECGECRSWEDKQTQGERGRREMNEKGYKY